MLTHENPKNTVKMDLCVQLESDLYPVWVVVQQQDTRAGHLFGFHHGFQISQ